MPSNTPNLSLYKKDPVADGNDTFNIKTMLNDNWDKIDTEVAAKETPTGAQSKADTAETNAKDYTDSEVEKISSELQENTIPIEATASIIPMPSAATNGQFSDVVLRGNTLFNYADNGVDYANWVIAGSGTTKGANGIHLVQNSTNEYAKLPTNLQSSTQYTLVYIVKQKDLDGTFVMNGYESIIDTDINLPQNLGINKVLFNTSSDTTNNNIKFVVPGNNTEGKYIDFEIYGILEGDYTDIEVGKLAYGANSTLPVRIKSICKNLFDGELEYGYIDSALGINSDYDTDTAFRSKNYIPVEPNTQYVLSTLTTAPKSFTWFYDVNKNAISRTGGMNRTADIFITPVNAKYVRFTLYSYDNKTSRDNDMNALKGILQLEKASSMTPYEPYKKSVVYLPPIGRSVGNVYDEINVSEGVHIQRVIDDVIFTGADIVSYQNNLTNVDVVKINIPSDMKLPTNSVDGETNVFGKIEVPYQTDPPADYVGKYNTNINNRFWFFVPKGTYTDLTDAQANFPSQALNYQLAEPIETKLPPQILQAYKDGTLYVENAYRDVGYVQGGKIQVANNIPVKSLENVSLIDKDTGALTTIDLTTITIDTDGLGFTVSGGTEGQYYEYVAEYDSSLSTIPTISAIVDSTVKDNLNSLNNSVSSLNKKANMQDNQIKILNSEVDTMKDGMGNLSDNKVDKIAGKGLSTEDYTTTEKNKLAGIATGANNYIHPSTHSASIITQDSSHRFVTDADKVSWNSIGQQTTGQVTYTDTIPANSALTKTIPIGTGYKEGKLIYKDNNTNSVLRGIVFFDNLTNTAKSSITIADSGYTGAYRADFRSKILDSYLGVLADYENSVFVDNAYISGSNLIILFRNTNTSVSKSIKVTVDWEVVK
ncbi:hypothetical protein [Tepidibacter mesophilus]|uniref:hypothetical protein n=1 Tax=Tepidibacter mesophilus TaxID=655607 RepID=UPI000C08D07C|nr:hypothetical protein [Tepidibacter mesophilus]